MGINFSFFSEPEHRVFNYRPRYSSRKDDGSAKEGKVQNDVQSEEYTPGQYVRGSFRDGNYQKTRMTQTFRLQRIIGIVGLILVFVILYFVAKFYGLILS